MQVDKIVGVKMIPVEQIEVLNPRDRNQKIFDEIVDNIKRVGLKKPINVISHPGLNSDKKYLLVCGEGRLTAFKRLGQTTIPAVVFDTDEEGAHLGSLTENIARHKKSPLETFSSITRLRDKGYTPQEIAKKIGCDPKGVYEKLTLAQKGEEGLLTAVLKGKIPLSAATSIVCAGDDDKAIQAALQEAYETGKLRGLRQLKQAKKLIERRKACGKSMRGSVPKKRTEEVSSSSLVRAYQKEVARQRLMVRKADYAQQRLAIVTGGLRQLLLDEDFGHLLRAEGLDTLPKYLSDRVWADGSH